MQRHSRASALAALLSLTTGSIAEGATAFLTRSSREVTSIEIAGGAPVGGLVHEFFLTSATDILLVGQVEINVPLYQHTLGSDVASAADSATDPLGLSADS